MPLFWDDGKYDHCSCCAHRRGEMCGGAFCACRIEMLERMNLYVKTGVL